MEFCVAFSYSWYYVKMYLFIQISTDYQGFLPNVLPDLF